MVAPEALPPRKRARRACSVFMGRIGQVKRTARRQRCEFTAPLFPLWLILDADGSLAGDLKPLVERTHA